MKILITGGAGYLGSVLTNEYLKDPGNVVIVVDNLMYGGEHLLDKMGTPSNFVFLNGDIRDVELVEFATQNCDAVIHLAAIVGDPACSANEELAYDVNVVGSKVVLDACRKNSVNQVIFASTCSNYGKMDREKYEYVNELSDIVPVSSYAKHKVEIENLLFQEHKDLSPKILRFATLHGLSPRMRFDLTVNQFMMEAVIDKKLSIYGAEFYRPYLHIQDAVRAVQYVLVNGKDFGTEVWNVGDNKENYTKRDLVGKINNVVDFPGFYGPVEVEYVYKEEDPRDYKVSFDKIFKDLGFRTIYTVEKSMFDVMSALVSKVIEDPKSDKWRN
jgi:nucleoside-diphosphate-sugar epimerase